MHWYTNTGFHAQVFLLHPSIPVSQGDDLTVNFTMSRSKENHRLMEVELDCEVKQSSGKLLSPIKKKFYIEWGRKSILPTFMLVSCSHQFTQIGESKLYSSWKWAKTQILFSYEGTAFFLSGFYSFLFFQLLDNVISWSWCFGACTEWEQNQQSTSCCIRR